MNKIYKNLIAIFVVITVVLFTFLSFEMIQSDVRSEEKYLTEIVSQVKKNIETAEADYDEKLVAMEKAWVDRIFNAESIIANEARMTNPSELQQMRTIMGAEDIHLLKEDGTIWKSTDETMVGTEFPDEEEGLSRLQREHSEGTYYMHIEDSGFWKDPTYCRLFMCSTSEAYAVICVEGDVQQMALKCERAIIDNALKEAATEYGTSVVAVGKDSGAVLGMTKNNKQMMQVKGYESSEELREFLGQNVEAGKKRTVVNGEFQILAIEDMDGAYIVAFCSINEMIGNMARQWIKTFLIFLIAIAVIVFAIQYNFDKYLMDQLQEMEEKLADILEGNFNVTLGEGNNQDINKLIRVIDKLKMGYIHKSERSDKIFDVLGENIAVFECVFEADYYYFSEKIKNMLGMTEQEWAVACQNRRALIVLIRSLDSDKDENNIVKYRDRYLEMQICPVGKELIGVIVDHTAEFKKRLSLESELRKSKESMVKDALTDVLNRRGFEEWVGRFLEQPDPEGVLIAFDLDNFKTINDTLGHPEGDKVLRLFASCLKELFREEDVIGRLGGDEFFVFVPNSISEENVTSKMQKARKHLNDTFGLYHTKYGVSASIGVVFTESGDNYKSLYKKADEALYEAKNSGKDRYVIYRSQE